MKHAALVATIKQGYPKVSRHLFINSASQKDVHQLVVSLSQEVSPRSRLPAYVIDGAMLGEHAWTFAKLKTPPVLQFQPNGTLLAESHLILPQDRPIILLVESFDQFPATDQRAFSHLVDGEGGDYSLAPDSLLICALYEASGGEVEAGALSRGLVLKLEAE